ncbi:MAG: ribonuclease III [Nitrospirae bacterium]|nr:ribonuclease III [Nitrospirota bacterium]
MPVSYLKNIEELEGLIGYKFKNKKLLLTALTHKSYYHESPDKKSDHNERLEFLGDSVLGLVIAEDLYKQKNILSESEMSKIKSCLVKESALFEIANMVSLGNRLRLGKGEDSTGGRHKRSILSDAVEALLGAIFLDSDYNNARSVILRLFRDRDSNVIRKQKDDDSKSELQERCQKIFGVLPEYRIVKQEGEEHKKVFTVEVYIDGRMFGKGAGKSKKAAQMTAAREALKELADE